MLARSDAEDDSVRHQNAKSPECLRDDRWVIPEGRCRNRRAQQDLLGPLACGGKPGDRKRRVAIGMTPGLEVIAHEDAFETVVFGGDREIEQLSRAELLG